MSVIGIYGGTFDPIHNGHLITAQAVKEIRNLDKVIFIPANISPFKQQYLSSSGKHRLNMLKLAIENIPYFKCSNFELKKKEISYTINTLMELKKKYDHIELIIGYDNFLSFDKWKSPKIILDNSTVVVLNRKTKVKNESYNKYYSKAVMVETPFIEISGTQIRDRVKNSLPINFLVPEKVKEYIYNFNLYKEKS